MYLAYRATVSSVMCHTIIQYTSASFLTYLQTSQYCHQASGRSLRLGIHSTVYSDPGSFSLEPWLWATLLLTVFSPTMSHATRTHARFQCFFRDSSWPPLPALTASAVPGVASSTRPRVAVWAFVFRLSFLSGAKEPCFGSLNPNAFHAPLGLARVSCFLCRPSFLRVFSGFLYQNLGFFRLCPRIFLGPALRIFLGPALGFFQPSLRVFLARSSWFSRHDSRFFWGLLGCWLATGVPRFEFTQAMRVSVVATVLAL